MVTRSRSSAVNGGSSDRRKWRSQDRAWPATPADLSRMIGNCSSILCSAPRICLGLLIPSTNCSRQRLRRLRHLRLTSSLLLRLIIGRAWAFAHMHDSAALLERNFIHQRSHQVNAATVSGHPVLGSSRVGYRTNVEAGALIPNRHRDFSVCTAAYSEVNVLARILPIAMDHGIQERLPQSYFNI